MNNIVKITNEIARMLGHACAIPAEHADRLQSLDALIAAWYAQGVEWNDTDPTVPGITGWNYDGSALSWETAGRRMRICVNTNSIMLFFSRGPEKGEQGGCDFLVLEYIPQGIIHWFVRHFDDWAVEDRLDRLELVANLKVGQSVTSKAGAGYICRHKSTACWSSRSELHSGCSIAAPSISSQLSHRSGMRCNLPKARVGATRVSALE